MREEANDWWSNSNWKDLHLGSAPICEIDIGKCIDTVYIEESSELHPLTYGAIRDVPDIVLQRRRLRETRIEK